MKDLEKVYDEEISPLMTKIIEVCNREKIPMFAEFQYADDGMCKTHLNHDGHPLFHHLEVLTRCRCEGGLNVDNYIMWLQRHAREHGHSSVCLKLLGVPESPDKSNDNIEAEETRRSE
jgi:hypothetical protein